MTFENLWNRLCNVVMLQMMTSSSPYNDRTTQTVHQAWVHTTQNQTVLATVHAPYFPRSK